MSTRIPLAAILATQLLISGLAMRSQQTYGAEPANKPPATKIVTVKTAPEKAAAKPAAAEQSPKAQPASKEAAQPLSARQRLLQKLAEKTQCEFVETPLRDALEFFKDLHDFEIQIDARALQEIGVGSDVPVNFTCSGITLQSALNLILRPLELAYLIEDESLVITSPEVLARRPELRSYPVRDLLQLKSHPGAEGAAMQELAALIKSTVSPETWDEVGGPGSIKERNGTILVRQPLAVQEELQRLLNCLRRLPALNDADLTKALPPAWCIPHRAEFEQKLAALEWPTPLEFVETPLMDVVAFVAKESGLTIQLDVKALAEIGVASDVAVTHFSRKLTLGAALRRILSQFDLCYTIQDEVLLITTPEVTESHLTLVAYPVADLLPLPPQPTRAELSEALVSLLADLQIIEPQAWDSVGGPGSMLAFINRGALVVAQTQAMHHKLAAALEEMRKAQAAQPREPITRPDGAEFLTVTYTFDAPPVPPSQEAPAPHNPAFAKVDTKLVAAAIQALIARESWQQKEGQAYLQPFPDRLVIRQQRRVQKEIIALLSQLGYHYQSTLPDRAVPQPIGSGCLQN